MACQSGGKYILREITSFFFTFLFHQTLHAFSKINLHAIYALEQFQFAGTTRNEWDSLFMDTEIIQSRILDFIKTHLSDNDSRVRTSAALTLVALIPNLSFDSKLDALASDASILQLKDAIIDVSLIWSIYKILNE